VHGLRGFPGFGQVATYSGYSDGLPVQGVLFVRQGDKLIEEPVCCRISSSAQGKGYRRDGQRTHQRRGVADLTRILERAVRVRDRGLRIAERPQSQ